MAVTKRQKSAANVGAAITSHAQEAQEALAGVFGPYLVDGETVPDLMPLQSLCGRILEQHRKEIVSSDEAHLAELQEDSDTRDRRDAAAAALADRLTLLRDGARILLGPKAAASLLRIDGALDRDPVVLARKGRRALEILQSETLELPRSQLSGVTLDPRPWAVDLEGPMIELEEALAVVAERNRRAESTLLAKQKALDAYDRAFLRIARLQECLFRFADLGSLADRVRPSRRRPGQTVVEEEAPEAQPPEAETPPTEKPFDPTEAAVPTA
jgi:hypothetical protein